MAPVDSMRTRVESAETPRAMRTSRAAETPGLFDGTAWRDAALVWLGQRLALGALMFLGMRLLGNYAREWGVAHLLANWDGDIYRNIASGGYREPFIR